MHETVTIVNHPLVQHKLSLMRDKHTSTEKFKKLAYETSMLLAFEATKHLPMETQTLTTPIETGEFPVLTGKKLVILPVLRAGLGMVDAFSTLIPSARVGHVGLYRDEKTLEAQDYYFKIPQDSGDRHFFICDPMIATGGTMCQVINKLKSENITSITVVCLVAAPEGLERVHAAHPEVPIITASIDQKLNADGYIQPGLGDAGDRLFGTK